MSPETLTDPTIEIETAPAPFELLVELCRENNLIIDAEKLAWLIPNIVTKDLENHPVSQSFGVEPMAVATREGLLLDQQFDQLTVEQRRYVLGHELGHYLSAYLKFNHPDIKQQLVNITNQVPNEKTSNYIIFLDQQLPEADHQEKIAEEKLAEMITQYLNGGGSFLGMLRAKLLTFPNLPSNNTDEYISTFEQAQEFENYLNGISPEVEPTELFEIYPALAPHYNAWRAISSILTNASTFDAMEEAISEPDGVDYYFDFDQLIDYPEMVENLEEFPSIITEPNNDPTKRQSEVKPFDFLTRFWQLLD